MSFFNFCITACFALMSFNMNAKALFSEDAFKKMTNDNQIILIDVYASWCSTCQKQEQIIQKYKTMNPDTKVKFLSIDFDLQKDWVLHFKAPRQSTMFLYQGSKQVWFTVAETDEDKIFSVLNQYDGRK